MITIDNIFVKYANSSEKWLLALPVAENGQLKLRCYMTRRNELTGVFNDCYTYNVDLNTLADFFSYKSHGQAYNELIKFKKARTGFIEESDHIKGVFMMSDILETVKQGRSKLVLEAVEHIMNLQQRTFTIEAITEIEKEQRKQEQIQLKKLENELMNLGYNY